MKNINDLRADWLAYHQLYDLGYKTEAYTAYNAFVAYTGEDFDSLDRLFEGETNGAPGLVITDIWGGGEVKAKAHTAFCRKYGITTYFVKATSTALLEYLATAINDGWKVTGTEMIPRPLGIGMPRKAIEEPALKLEMNA